MLDTPWTKRAYSIYVNVQAPGISQGGWTSIEPFEATAEEATVAMTNLRTKVQSLLVNHRHSVEGLIIYKRTLDSFGSDKVACWNECIIPATVLTTGTISYTLVKNKKEE